jgi:hypothetical protein
MRAVARLPGIDIDILHRRSEEAEAEEMLIRVRAAPSFEAALGAFEAANPFLMWSRMVQAAWVPWLALMAPTASRRLGHF